uniref:EF-hand domain-containing protein n=1 Tax=Alexandrium monilatum TaxID=311494 RepID=A0A7S4SUN5_9DINO
MVPLFLEPVLRCGGDVVEDKILAEGTGDLNVSLRNGPPYDAVHFKRAFSRTLADVEQCAVTEMQALTEALATLRTENADLRRRVEWSQAVAFDADHLSNMCREKQTQALDIYEEAGTPAPPAEREEEASIGCDGGLPPRKAAREGDAESGGVEQQRSSEVGQEITTNETVLRSQTARTLYARHLGISSFESERQAKNNVRELLARSRRRLSTRSVPLRKRGCAQRLRRSTAFECATLAVVLANAVWIAVDLDYNGRPLLKSPPLFQVMESLFIAFFVLEMTVRFMTFPLCRSAVRDPWFVFDAVLVLVMLLESCVLSIVLAVTDHSSIAGLAVGQFSALRILRFLRIARVAKIGRFLPELRTMVAGILMSVRSVLITAVLLVLLTYAFAIFLRELGMSSEWGEQHFGSVVGSCYTLLFASLFPDNVSLMDQIREDSWFCAGLYYIFLLLSSVMIMNLLIGILCDGISRASDAEHDENNVERMCARLREIMTSVDKDFDGLVTKAEFDSILRNEQAVRMLSKVGVDVATMVGQANSIFHGPNQSGLPFDEFKEEVLKYRTSSVATDGSVTATRRLLHYSLEHISGRIDDMYALMLKHGEA